jgi:putative component of toxin-antitoxin plasmid stabilization module
MPQTRVLFFKDEGGQAPVLDWLRELRDKNAKAWANCRARIVLLSQFGHELRRPAADYLRDGIYELRAKQGHVQFRMLYFFHGRNVAVLSHSLTKEAAIPAVDIERTLERKRQFELEPEKHTYAED